MIFVHNLLQMQLPPTIKSNVCTQNFLTVMNTFLKLILWIALGFLYSGVLSNYKTLSRSPSTHFQCRKPVASFINNYYCYYQLNLGIRIKCNSASPFINYVTPDSVLQDFPWEQQPWIVGQPEDRPRLRCSPHPNHVRKASLQFRCPPTDDTSWRSPPNQPHFRSCSHSAGWYSLAIPGVTDAKWTGWLNLRKGVKESLV